MTKKKTIRCKECLHLKHIGGNGSVVSIYVCGITNLSLFDEMFHPNDKENYDCDFHLAKIQEVLPICMICGKVKTSGTNWEDVVDYFLRSNLSLSHGYCPSCLEKEIKKLSR